MQATKVPIWSFLAVEPAVRVAVRKSPQALRDFVAAKSTAQRTNAFWALFESIERHAIQRTPFVALDRHKLVVQSYYALIDLYELNDSPDRDVQRWLESILKSMTVEANLARAVVASPRANVTVA